MTYRVIYPYRDDWELEKIERIIFPRRTLREIYEKDLVIIVRADKVVSGLVNNRYKNILVWNFWQLLNGILAEVRASGITTGGVINPGGITLYTIGDVNAGSAYVTFGTNTTPESYDQYALGARSTSIEGATISPGVIAETGQYRLRFGRVSAGTVYEVGLYQLLYYGTYINETMLGRVVYSGGIPSGKNVYYDILVKPPFLKNFVYYLFGLLTNTDQSLVDRAGATFTARTSGDAQSGGLFMRVGTGTGAFDFETYELTSPLDCLSATNLYWADRTYSFLQASGAIRFTTAYTVSEVGVYQNIYDTGGATHPTLLMRFVLPSPIS
ncbi:MAG: hypothetical protein C0179_00395, partial [Fervidicoccus sp.]